MQRRRSAGQMWASVGYPRTWTIDLHRIREAEDGSLESRSRKAMMYRYSITESICTRSDFPYLCFVASLLCPMALLPNPPPLLPTHQPLSSIETPPQLPFRLHNLPLQHRKLDNPLTILRPHSREPDTLSSFPSILPPVYHYIRRKLVSSDMADEIYAYSTGALIV